ncbi:DUF5050 domain-containing protein [Paenibacillus sp. TRM 82003]|nr:DUF5050 domain-containing protein [Paenibacillus sp. TRM 82003]
MKRLLITLTASACVLANTGAAPIAYAEETKRPLTEAFDDIVVVPYDYQGKSFVRGQKVESSEAYEMVRRNGRVLVPIRLMGTLASQVGSSDGQWDIWWDAQRPNDVRLVNQALRKTITFTVNSTTMQVNGESVTLDVPPQKIDGRIMLPLRSAAAALGKRIDWLDGLILLGDESVDLQHSETTNVKDRIEKQLIDPRRTIEGTYDTALTARLGSASYYARILYLENGAKEELYRKTDGGKETKIPLPGEPRLSTAKLIDDTLYYVSEVEGKGELYAFDLSANEASVVAALGEWHPMDGWLAGVYELDGELYVNLHRGDLTMGGETVYKVSDGELKKVLSAKSLVHLAKAGDDLYYSDFRFMSGPANNLYRVDAAGGEEETIGQPGYTYGMVRDVDSGGVGYSHGGSFVLQDGFLYTLGYAEEDLADKSAVYKLDLELGTQSRLTGAARTFWPIGERIYYVDGDTRAIRSVGASGGDERTHVASGVRQVERHGDSLYYIDEADGALYRYDVTSGRAIGMSDRAVHGYHVAEAGVYYVSNGYEPGLYSVDPEGRSARIVDDTIALARADGDGIMYTLAYKEGVYFIK